MDAMILGEEYANTLIVLFDVAVRPRLSVTVTAIVTLPDELIVPVVIVVPVYVDPSTLTLQVLIVDPLDPDALVTTLSVDLDCTYPAN